MSIAGPNDNPDALGDEQASEIDPGGADPREPFTEVASDQGQEIDPEAPAQR